MIEKIILVLLVAGSLASICTVLFLIHIGPGLCRVGGC